MQVVLLSMLMAVHALRDTQGSNALSGESFDAEGSEASGKGKCKDTTPAPCGMHKWKGKCDSQVHCQWEAGLATPALCQHKPGHEAHKLTCSQSNQYGCENILSGFCDWFPANPGAGTCKAIAEPCGFFNGERKCKSQVHCQWQPGTTIPGHCQHKPGQETQKFTCSQSNQYGCENILSGFCHWTKARQGMDVCKKAVQNQPMCGFMKDKDACDSQAFCEWKTPPVAPSQCKPTHPDYQELCAAFSTQQSVCQSLDKFCDWTEGTKVQGVCQEAAQPGPCKFVKEKGECDSQGSCKWYPARTIAKQCKASREFPKYQAVCASLSEKMCLQLYKFCDYIPEQFLFD